MNKTMNLVLRLFIICAITAAVLGFTNATTAPVIAKQREEKTKEAFTKVYPDAEFTIVEDESLLTENIVAIVEASIGGEQDGYAFSVNSPNGYGGPVSFAVGVKNDGTITGFEVIKHSETKGFGARVADPGYKEGLNGVMLNAPVVANGKGGKPSEVPALAGATKTTMAMEAAFNMVVEKWAELTGNTVDMNAKPEPVEEEPAAKLEEVTPEALAAFIGADEVIPVENAPLNDIVLAVYEAKGGEAEGKLFHAKSPDGFEGPVEFVVGVAEDGTINFFNVIKHSETPGIGGVVEDSDFADGLKTSKLEAPEMAFTEATHTQTAMQEAFAAIAEAYAALK